MSLLKAAFSVSGNTFLSRITGFFRDILIARFLGAGDMADIWISAFRFPNLFRRIIAEGAFSAAFIPIYGKLQTKNPQEATHFTGNILSLMGIWIVIAIVFLQLFMPYLIYIFAPGFSEGFSEDFSSWITSFGAFLLLSGDYPPFPEMVYNDKISLAVSLTILCLPYAGFMFITALLSAILNYHHNFYAPSLSPILLNITLIIAMGLCGYYGYNPLWGLGYGVLIAGLLQVVWLYSALRKKGLTLHFGKITPTEEVKAFKKLFWPGIVTGGITQINLMIGSMMASFEAGAMAILYYADRIYQLPLGIVGVTLGVVLLPYLVKNIQEKNIPKAKDLLKQSIHMAMFFTLPASISMLVIPETIVRILFEYGAFTADDTQTTATVLRLYAIGLPFFIFIKIFNSGFYALEETRKPMIFAFQSVLVNIFVSICFFPWMGFYAIALGTVIASAVNMGFLGYGLYQKKMLSALQESFIYSFKVFLACGFMAGGIVFVSSLFPLEHTPYEGLLILWGVCLYFGIAFPLDLLPKKALKQALSS